MTSNDVVEAFVTVACVAPKKTMLLASVVLKFVPVMVTVVPIGPVVGAKLAWVGTDDELQTAPDGVSLASFS